MGLTLTPRELAFGYVRHLVTACDAGQVFACGDRLTALVSRCPTAPDQWRVTWFTDGEPTGHTNRPTACECAQEAIDSGYEPVGG